MQRTKNLVVVSSILLATLMLGVGCASSVDSAAKAYGAALDRAAAGPAPVFASVVVTPKDLDRVSEIQVQFRGPESDSNTVITSQSSEAFSMTFDANGVSADEINTFLTKSVQEKKDKQLLVTIGDREIHCIESDANGTQGIKGVCVRRLTIHAPAGIKVLIADRDSLFGTVFGPKEIKPGETFKLGALRE